MLDNAAAPVSMSASICDRSILPSKELWKEEEPATSKGDLDDMLDDRKPPTPRTCGVNCARK